MFIEPLVATVFALLMASVVAFFLTKKMRKRIRTERTIKKLCKREGYRFVRNRGITRSFSWNTTDHDFTVVTGKYVYYVHYLTPRRYRSSLTFDSKDGIAYATKPLNNNFTAITGPLTYKRIYKTDFSPLSKNMEKKTSVRVILVNPVCAEMYEASRDGGLVSTGNGLTRFGYTVMTGSGFAEAIQRNEI